MSAGPTSKQPFNNSPDNSSAEQYTYVTGKAQDGIDVKFSNSYVSVQGTDSNGNKYYWVSFLIDPPSNALSLGIATVTQPGTVVNLNEKKYYILYACDENKACPDGLGCFADPITKKSYCAGIGYGPDGVNWVMMIFLIILILVLVAIAIFLTIKFFHIVNVGKK